MELKDLVGWSTIKTILTAILLYTSCSRKIRRNLQIYIAVPTPFERTHLSQPVSDNHFEPTNYYVISDNHFEPTNY